MSDLNTVLKVVRAAESVAVLLDNFGISQRKFNELREQAYEQGLEEIPDVMIQAQLNNAQSAVDQIGVDD